MSTAQPAKSAARGGGETIELLALGALGAWASAVPYLGPPLGLRLVGISSRTEIVDHVVPGVLVVALSAALLALAGSPQATPGTVVPVTAAAVCALAAFWITATHVGLLVDAVGGDVAVGPALLHGTAGPLVLVPAALVLARQLRAAA